MAVGVASCFLIILLATVLLIPGMLSDDWISVGNLTIGPFRSCQKGKCSVEIPRNDYLQASTWLLVCSVAANFLSLIMSAVCVTIPKERRSKVFISMEVLSAIAGISSLTALLLWMGRFASLNVQTSAFHHGWALVPLSTLLSLLHVAASVFLNKETKPKHAKPDHTNVNDISKPAVFNGFTCITMDNHTDNHTVQVPENTPDHEDVADSMEDREHNRLDLSSEFSEQEATNDVSYSNSLDDAEVHRNDYKDDPNEDEWSTFTPEGILGNRNSNTEENNNNNMDESNTNNNELSGQPQTEINTAEENLPESTNQVQSDVDEDVINTRDSIARSDNEDNAVMGQDEQFNDHVPVAPPPPPIVGIH